MTSQSLLVTGVLDAITSLLRSFLFPVPIGGIAETNPPPVSITSVALLHPAIADFLGLEFVNTESLETTVLAAKSRPDPVSPLGPVGPGTVDAGPIGPGTVESAPAGPVAGWAGESGRMDNHCG